MPVSSCPAGARRVPPLPTGGRAGTHSSRAPAGSSRRPRGAIPPRPPCPLAPRPRAPAPPRALAEDLNVKSQRDVFAPPFVDPNEVMKVIRVPVQGGAQQLFPVTGVGAPPPYQDKPPPGRRDGGGGVDETRGAGGHLRVRPGRARAGHARRERGDAHGRGGECPSSSSPFPKGWRGSKEPAAARPPRADCEPGLGPALLPPSLPPPRPRSLLLPNPPSRPPASRPRPAAPHRRDHRRAPGELQPLRHPAAGQGRGGHDHGVLPGEQRHDHAPPRGGAGRGGGG